MEVDMKKIMKMIMNDLFMTYVPALLTVLMACIFAAFFPGIWGRLTVGWIILMFIFIWKKL